MFFLISLTREEKDLALDQDLIIHGTCGAYGRYQPFMISSVLRLFFIPLFRFSKSYYVRMSCCGEVYGLREEAGRDLARGRKSQIRPEDLVYINDYSGQKGPRRCPSCGYLAQEEDFYCSQCGSRL